MVVDTRTARTCCATRSLALHQAADVMLLREHIKGNRTAFSQLLARHSAQLWWSVLRTHVPVSHRMDVFQEGLLRVHRFAHSYDMRQAACVGTWMCTIMRNAALSYMDRYYRERHLYEHSIDTCFCPISDCDMPGDVAITRLDLEYYMRQLPQDLRRVLHLSVVLSYRESEIADFLGIPVGTVKSKKFRAKKILRSLLTGVGEYARLPAG